MQPLNIRSVIDQFNNAFQLHQPDLLDDLVARECVLENTVPAPDGERHVGREACLSVWRAIASDQQGRFELEETRVVEDHALIFWRYRWSNGESGSVRGINVMRVIEGQIIEGRGYVKQAATEGAST